MTSRQFSGFVSSLTTHSVVCQSTRQRFFPCTNKRQLNRSDNKSCPERNVRVVKWNSMPVPLANVCKNGITDYFIIKLLIMQLFGSNILSKAWSSKLYPKKTTHVKTILAFLVFINSTWVVIFSTNIRFIREINFYYLSRRNQRNTLSKNWQL